MLDIFLYVVAILAAIAFGIHISHGVFRELLERTFMLNQELMYSNDRLIDMNEQLLHLCDDAMNGHEDEIEELRHISL